MKKYLKFLFITFSLTFIVLSGTILIILKVPGGIFRTSYQSIIVDKYRLLQKTNDPKIIIVAGSSSAFGLNQKMLEDASGYKVVDLGLHAGFGNLFPTELSKENINKGDIVLLGYEYTWINGFNSLNQELVMTGIDDNIDMYKHIPIKKWPEFIGYIFKFLEKKVKYFNNEEINTGIYSIKSFDLETTQMIGDREFTMSDYDTNRERYTYVDLKDFSISDDTILYLKNYKDYVENRGAHVYFISPPIYKKAIACDYSEFSKLKQFVEDNIGIKYISNPTDYFFDDKLMSNEIYHCNKAGEIKRTELLIGDLKNGGIIK